MDRLTNNPQRPPAIRIVSLEQEINVIATGTNEKGETIELVLTSHKRPLPVPYTEQP